MTISFVKQSKVFETKEAAADEVDRKSNPGQVSNGRDEEEGSS